MRRLTISSRKDWMQGHRGAGSRAAHHNDGAGDMAGNATWRRLSSQKRLRLVCEDSGFLSGSRLCSTTGPPRDRSRGPRRDHAVITTFSQLSTLLTNMS